MPTVYGILIASVLLLGATAVMIATDKETSSLEIIARRAYNAWQSPLWRMLGLFFRLLDKFVKEKPQTEADVKEIESIFETETGDEHLKHLMMVHLVILEEEGKINHKISWADAWPLLLEAYRNDAEELQTIVV